MESSNNAATRAALEHLMEFTCNSCQNRLCEDDVEYVEGKAYTSPCGAIIEAKNALAAPARNCDVGTAKEQTERFETFCQSNMQFYKDMFGHDEEGRLDGWDCRKDCPIGRMIDAEEAVSDHCQLAWAQMPFATAEGETKGRQQ